MAGFMAGFGTTLAQLIEEDRKYYRDAAAKRRDYIQTYGTRAVSEREDKANAALGVANTLMNRGFSKEYVTNIAANNGVRSMVEFAEQISKRTDLTEKDIKEIEASAKDFVKDNPQEDLTSVVKRAYGLYKSTKDPVARKRNIFGAMLGLDASMMEDDVLNDMYIDGYTGSDIYRIMGSAGPGAGKPMGVKLPPKARGYKENLAYRAAISQEADNFIAYELEEIGQKIKDTPDSGAKQTLQTTKDTLLRIQGDLKTDPSGAMAEYLGMSGVSYNSSLLATIQQTEDAYAGSITSNPLLTDKFKTTYGQLVGDIKDDEAAAKAPGTQEPKGDGKVDEPPKKTTHKVTSEAEALELITSGKVKIGDDIDINGTIRPVKNLPESVSGPGPSAPFDLSLDGLKGDRSPREDVVPSFSSNVTPETVAKVEQAFDPVVADEKELTVEDQAEQRYDAVQSTIDNTKKSAGQTTVDVATVITNIYDIGQRQATKFKWNTTNWATTELGTIAQYFGYEDLAKDLYKLSIKNKDRGTSSPLLSQQINDLLDSYGWADYSEGVNLPSSDTEMSGAGPVLGAIPLADTAANFIRFLSREKSDTDTLTTSAFDTEQRQGLEDFIRAAQRRAYKPASSQEESDEKPIYSIEDIKAYAENRLGAREKQAMEDRIRDDARQFLQDEKSFPQPLPTIIVEKLENDIVEEAKVDVEAMRIVQQLDKKGETPSRKDIEDLKTALELNQAIDTETQELYRGPISGKTLVEKLDDLWNFYTKGEEPEDNPRAIGTVGSRDLGLRDTTDDVRPPRNREPDAQTRTRAPLGDTRTEPDATVPSITEVARGDRPSGLMSPQSSGTAPKLGQAEFGDLIDRVHGSSKAAEAFNNKVSSGKVTAADVTRLIKATRKLPNTKSKDKLLNSLFDLRDALNKR